MSHMWLKNFFCNNFVTAKLKFLEVVYNIKKKDSQINFIGPLQFLAIIYLLAIGVFFLPAASYKHAGQFCFLLVPWTKAFQWRWGKVSIWTWVINRCVESRLHAERHQCATYPKLLLTLIGGHRPEFDDQLIFYCVSYGPFIPVLGSLSHPMVHLPGPGHLSEV